MVNPGREPGPGGAGADHAVVVREDEGVDGRYWLPAVRLIRGAAAARRRRCHPLG